MASFLTQKKLGKRIAELRKKKGFSQEDLAHCLKISRTSLTQIELGNRGVDVIEFQNLAQILGFSLDYFLSENYTIKNEQEFKKTPIAKTKDRISVSSLNVNKFKNVLLYILEQCAGKPNVGETVLNKLLYFSDFNYYELYEEHLTGANYKKLPYGPVPQKLDFILNEMLESGDIQRVKTRYHDFPQTRYIPLIKPNLTKLLASETEVLDNVIEQMGDWSATAISNYSHNDLPWEVTEEGHEINYELAFYREQPYSVRNYSDDFKENEF